MIYEIESRGRAFSIRIQKTGGELDAGPWQIEALAGVGEGAAAVVEQGATRSDALSAVARSWRTMRLESDLPDLDWEEITRALDSVRAI
jgi:hypothetical protein